MVNQNYCEYKLFVSLFFYFYCYENDYAKMLVAINRLGGSLRNMIIGTGIDIVELQRIEEAMNRHRSFIKRILSEKEAKFFQTLSDRRKVEFLAGRFAAKEAFAKAVGTGIGKQLSWQDIEVLPDSNGKPMLRANKALGHVHLSISHSKEYAVANVIIESHE